MFIRAAQQFAEKLAFATSAAEALTKTKGLSQRLSAAPPKIESFSKPARVLYPNYF
jgi:hypothetical protein